MAEQQALTVGDLITALEEASQQVGADALVLMADDNPLVGVSVLDGAVYISDYAPDWSDAAEDGCEDIPDLVG
jgi:hypothetical protein